MLISTQSPRNSHLALKSIHYQKGCIELYPSTAQDLVSDLALCLKQNPHMMGYWSNLNTGFRCYEKTVEPEDAIHATVEIYCTMLPNLSRGF